MPYQSKKEGMSFENPELKSVKGVEVFMTGKWNGDRYTDEDLDAMIANFGIVEAPLKIGHGEQEFSGVPAVGWIEKIYKEGKKLFADIKDIPEFDIQEPLENKIQSCYLEDSLFEPRDQWR